MIDRAAPDQTIPGLPLPTRAGAIVVFFFGFLLVGLNCIADRGIFDMSLVPRLQSLLLFLAVTVAALAVPGAARGLDWSVLRSPLVLWFGAYAAISCLSLLVAINATAGFTDITDRTISVAHTAPLGPEPRRWVQRHVRRNVEWVEAALSVDDREALLALADAPLADDVHIVLERRVLTARRPT